MPVKGILFFLGPVSGRSEKIIVDLRRRGTRAFMPAAIYEKRVKSVDSAGKFHYISLW